MKEQKMFTPTLYMRDQAQDFKGLKFKHTHETTF